MANLCHFRFGAVVAVGIFSLFPENPIALSIFGFFYSMPCFYYIVAKPQYATSGRFVLLTYNLTCLYWYVLGMSFTFPDLFSSSFIATISVSATYLYGRSHIIDLLLSLRVSFMLELYLDYGGLQKLAEN